jgi:thiol-disulfide isomerase/thioredoxin
LSLQECQGKGLFKLIKKVTFLASFYMKKYIFVHFIFFLGSYLCTAQDSIRICGQLLNNSRFAKVIVKKFNIGNYDIAAVPINEDGSFSITAPKDIQSGVYRFQYSQSTENEYVDVILDGREAEIHFTLDLNIPIENRIPLFSQSIENRNWYTYQTARRIIIQKIQALQQLVALYPTPNDKIVQQVQDALATEQKEYYHQEAFFLNQNNNTWASKMIANTPYYFTNPKDDWRLQDFEKREHYWDKISTTAPELINSPLYTERILEYLKYYMNPAMKFSEEDMNEGFIKSVDIIIQKFSGNVTTKKFAIQYLQLGFKEIGNEKVLQYIDEKYATQEQCTTSDNDLQKRLKAYDAMKVGNTAPDIAFTTLDFNLHALAAERTIVVFWASWCPHCIEELPKLNEWAKVNPSIKVVAISLDDDKVSYESTKVKFPILIHDTDLKKWEGKAVSDYFVYGTPTFILMDKDKKILGKYTSLEQLKTFINLN